MNEPSPLAPLVTPRTFHSFYVDNYDELHVVWETDVGIYEGKPSDSQVRLRREMERIGVERDPQKAAENSKSWTSLGAEVDGIAGRVGSSLKFRRALLGANLQSSSEPGLRRHSLDFQSVVSKNMHSVQYNRSFACLFHEIYLSMGQSQNGEVSQGARDELLLLSCSLPFHWISQRSGVCGQVFATDASPDGGGACISTGLTRSGFGRVHSLVHEAEGENGASDPLVVVEMFAGMGGLHQALELLGLTPMGVIGVDISSRDLPASCGNTVGTSSGTRRLRTSQEVNASGTLLRWRLLFPKGVEGTHGRRWVAMCQPQRALNTRRQGASAESSRLVGLQWWTFSQTGWKIVSGELGLAFSGTSCELYENVIMDKFWSWKRRVAKIGVPAHAFVEAAAGWTWVRRPRLFWQLKNIPLIRRNRSDAISSGPTVRCRGQDYAVPTSTGGYFRLRRSPLRQFPQWQDAQRLAEPNASLLPHSLDHSHDNSHQPPDPAGLAAMLKRKPLDVGKEMLIDFSPINMKTGI